MAQPLELNTAQQLKKIKQELKLTYTELGKQIGLSGTMLSARVVRCTNNPDNKKPLALSNQSLMLIDSFLKAQTKVSIVNLEKIETTALIVELKRRGASSIVF
jgi:predicted transcriptional regulator